MKKTQLVEDILRLADIHHNISITKWSAIPEDFDWQFSAETTLENAVENFMGRKENDKGNRNLCACEKKWSNGACPEHDVWRLYQAGRSGATLYWTKYWNESNSQGVFFQYDDKEELSAMSFAELKTMRKDLLMFHAFVENLMKDFYAEVEYQYKEQVQQKADDEKRERAKQKAIAIIKKHGLLKEIVQELL